MVAAASPLLTLGVRSLSKSFLQTISSSCSRFFKRQSLSCLFLDYKGYSWFSIKKAINCVDG